MPSIRIDKMLSQLGICSRRDTRGLVQTGRLTVNGAKVPSADSRVDTEADRLELDGQPLNYQQHIYLMMNKPAGVISASNEPGRKTVVDLVPAQYARRGLFPAGRLDADTLGFVLITDDGDFAHRILSPKKHVPKIYTALLDKPIDREMIDDFARGVDLGKDICLPAELAEIGENGCLAQVVLRQGMYHQIKRMFAHYGRTVLLLRRIKIGGLELDPALKEGECRPLTQQEVSDIEKKENTLLIR